MNRLVAAKAAIIRKNRNPARSILLMPDPFI